MSRLKSLARNLLVPVSVQLITSGTIAMVQQVNNPNLPRYVTISISTAVVDVVIQTSPIFRELPD
ncbi:hypothetical protein [Sphaerothrix gracilis]|uniref:hypothetical protein n=1 Tax=Sphaerothrix gracilis TaxID=3151835 RepID=UPI0031FD0F20